ncbi:phosphatase PAP2 family protein [Ilumatobacter sp.]|uniref:phosphatase PAP2 family protein n=2 Tax=Ilumatobacter sp. TaxID=1967498 RepID=UPI00375302C8
MSPTAGVIMAHHIETSSTYQTSEVHARANGHAAIDSRPRRGIRHLATQVVLVVAAAIAYFGVRGLTEGSQTTAVGNGNRVLDLERSLGIDLEQTFQGAILDHDTIVTAVNWIYIWGHWPVIGLTLAWLYRSRRASFLLLRNAMFISGAIGLVIFISFPVAPPRLMPSGFVDTVTELSTSYHVLQPPALVNKFAAVPSLHVGWNLLVGVLIFTRSCSKVAKLFALAGPALMAFAVVLTANHYILDAIAGSVVALAGLSAAGVLARRNHRRASIGGTPNIDRCRVVTDLRCNHPEPESVASDRAA